MRIIVLGAVAAGTSAAAKARRNDENAKIVVYEKDSLISYAGCGMPYYLGGVVRDPAQLTPRSPGYFKRLYNIDILTRHEVIKINPAAKTVTVRNLESGQVFDDNFDKLIIATGASPVIPKIAGIDRPNVFLLRNIHDMDGIKRYIDGNKPARAAVIGAGFIGLEICENLKNLGIDVTIIERAGQVLPSLDIDMAAFLEAHLKEKGVAVKLNATAKQISTDGVETDDGQRVPADMVIISVGVRPNTVLAADAGIELGQFGGIKVNAAMQTNFRDIYACGDCIEQFHVVTGKPVYRPLGSTANKTGRIAGDNATGGNSQFRGVLGTAIVKVFDMAAAQTGLTVREARAQGFDIEVIHNLKHHKPDYMGGRELVIKAIADRKDGRLLGAQIVGQKGVDKRIDVFAAAITFGAKAEDLVHLDLAYAPPFSIAKDPVNYTGMILSNALNHGRKIITPAQLDQLLAGGEKIQLIDTRPAHQFQKGHIQGAVSIPLDKLREAAEGLDKDATTVVYCTRAVTANAAQNILINKGFSKVYNLSGGITVYSATHKN